MNTYLYLQALSEWINVTRQDKQPQSCCGFLLREIAHRTTLRIKNACPPSLTEHHVWCLLWSHLNICQPVGVTDDINCSRALALLCGSFSPRTRTNS